MIKIEKGVQITPKGGGGPKNIYPFKEMVVGDSFFVPFGTGDKKKVRITVATSASRFAKENPGTMFITRTIENGVRCWRIS